MFDYRLAAHAQKWYQYLLEEQPCFFNERIGPVVLQASQDKPSLADCLLVVDPWRVCCLKPYCDTEVVVSANRRQSDAWQTTPKLRKAMWCICKTRRQQ